VRWNTVTITEEIEGQPMTAPIIWRTPGYELFLEMRGFAEALREVHAG
jgi:hypothetical protein